MRQKYKKTWHQMTVMEEQGNLNMKDEASSKQLSAIVDVPKQRYHVRHQFTVLTCFPSVTVYNLKEKAI